MCSIRIPTSIVLLCWLVPAVLLPAGDSGTVAEPLGVVTLRQALELAGRSSPGLAAAEREIAIRRAERTQAGLLPNPAVSYEVENFGGDNEFTRTRALEQTARISQDIELGGKRGGRKALAQIHLNTAELEYRAAELELAAEVKTAFYTLLAAQEMDSLAHVKVHLAHEVYNTISKRVDAGKVSPVELSRAEIALSRADIETGRYAAGLASARQALAATWGARDVTFDRVDGEFELLKPPGELAEILAGAENSLSLAIAREQVESNRAGARLVRAERFPDLVLTGGFKDARDAGSRGFVAEVGIPLPLFNRNQGHVRAADAAVEQAEFRSEQTWTELVSKLTAVHTGLAAAHREAVALRDRVVSGAEKVFSAIRIGYTEGKFGYLELLDAQSSLFEARGSYIEALKSYHLSRTELDRLLGAEQDPWRQEDE